jgi:hypothetical protein
MKLQSRKTVYIVLVFLLLLAGLASTAHAAITCPGALPQGTQGTAYSYTFTGNNGNGFYPWWRITAGSLPPGLNLTDQHTNSVTVSGTPSVAGTYTFTITHNESGIHPTCTCTITINPPLALTPTNGITVSPNVVRNLYYTSTTTFTASGGTPPYTWSTPWALPAGLSLSSTSGNNITIRGTTNASTGTKTFRIRVQDSNGARVTYTDYIRIITSGCDFVGGIANGAISFGASIDPLAAGPVTGSVDTPVQFTCTAGQVYSIEISPGSGWQLTSGSNTISYTLGVIPSGGPYTYGGTAVNVFTAGSSMTQPQYGNAPPGNYSNTSAITITIRWTTNGGGSIQASLPIGSVTGTVIPSCRGDSAGTLNFPSIDPSATAPATASSSGLTYKCSNGTSFSITGLSSAGGGTGTCTGFTGTLKSTGTPADTLSYTAACSTGAYAGTGYSAGVNMPISGTIASSQYQDAKAHTDYSDTLTVTISY